MHNIAQNYTQVKNTVTKKNSEYIFLNKKKIYNTHIPFFLEEGGILYYKKKKKINHNLTKITKKCNQLSCLKLTISINILV